MEEDLKVRPDLTIPGREIDFSASRSGGPGGQNVNKVATKVTLRFNVRDSEALDDAHKKRIQVRLANRITTDGDLVIQSDEHRTQPRNREAARERLASLIRAALRVDRRRIPTRPTRASVKRRLSDKKRRAGVKKTRGKPSLED